LKTLKDICFPYRTPTSFVVDAFSDGRADTMLGVNKNKRYDWPPLFSKVERGLVNGVTKEGNFGFGLAR
jgi:hypothetical protein